jgi:hypothetical protein
MEKRSLTDFGPHLFVITLFAALLVPALFMDGMFMDGVFYAAISRNYAEGFGTFWEMTFSQTHHVHMHEQPPLMFALEAIFFKVFSGIYPERVYSLLAASVNTALIMRSWQIIARSEKVSGFTKASTTWLPLLLWIIMPVTFHAFTNNLEEGTMTIFSMLAFNAVLRALLDTTEKKAYWLIAGVWLVAAGLTKGVQGMFLLSVPFWAWIILRNGSLKDFCVRTALISCAPVVFVIIAWFTPVIHESFAEYFGSRYVKTFSNVTANSQNHFHILYELLLDTLPTLAIMFMLALAGRKTVKFFDTIKSNRRLIFFVFACAFSGILPLMVTREQRGFYLVTALPLVAIACALLVHPSAQRLTEYIRSKKIFSKAFFGFAAIGLCVVITITVLNAGKFKCSENEITSLREMTAITGEGVIVGVNDAIANDWWLITLAQRYHHVSITSCNDPKAHWCLVQKGTLAPEGSTQVPLNSTIFDLYEKK